MSTSTPPPSQATATLQHPTTPKRPLGNANREDDRAKRRYLGKNPTERPLTILPAYLLHALICGAHDYAYTALSERVQHESREVQNVLEPCPREGVVHGITPLVSTEAEQVVTDVLLAAGHYTQVLYPAVERARNNMLQLQQMARDRPLTAADIMQELLESDEIMKVAISSLPLETRTIGSCGVLATNNQRQVVQHENDDNPIALPTISASTNNQYQPVNGLQHIHVQPIAHATTSRSGAPNPVVKGRSSAVLQATTNTQSAQRIVDGVGPSSDGQGQLDSESAGHAEASMRSEGSDVEMYESDDEAVDEETAVEENIVGDMSQRRAKTAASKPTGACAQRGPQRPKGGQTAKAQAVVSREPSDEQEGSQNSDESDLSEYERSQTNTRAPKPRKAPSKKSTRPPNRAKTAKAPTVVNAVLLGEASPEPEESQDSKDQKAYELAEALWEKYVDQELPQPLFTLRLSLQAYDSVDAQQPHARAVLIHMFDHEYMTKTENKANFSKKCQLRVKNYLSVLKHLASAFSRGGLERLQSARIEVQYGFSKRREETAVQSVAALCSDQYVSRCIKAMGFLSRRKRGRVPEAEDRATTVQMYLELHNVFQSTLHSLIGVSAPEARVRLLLWASEHGFHPDDPDLEIAKVGKPGYGREKILSQLCVSIFSRNEVVRLAPKEFSEMRRRAKWVWRLVSRYSASIFVMVEDYEALINAGARELRSDDSYVVFLNCVESSLGELSKLTRNADLLLQEQHLFRKVELSSLLDLSNLTDDILATLDEDEGEGGDAHGTDTNSETEAEENEATDDRDEVGDQDDLGSTDAPEDELNDARNDGSSSHAQLSSTGSQCSTRNVSPGEELDEIEATDDYGHQASIDAVADSHTSNSGRCTVATGSLSDEQPKAAAETSESIVVPGVPQNAAPRAEPMDMDLDEFNNVARLAPLSTPATAPVAQPAFSSHNWSTIAPEDSTEYVTDQTQLGQSWNPNVSPTNGEEYGLDENSLFEDQIWYQALGHDSRTIGERNGENWSDAQEDAI